MALCPVSGYQFQFMTRCIVVHSLSFAFLSRPSIFLSGIFSMYYLLVNVAFGAASIVEPHGFSGSLPVMFSMCCKLCDSIQANKDVLFCSYLGEQVPQSKPGWYN